MSEAAGELTPSTLAFRVAVFAGVLGAMGWLPGDAHWFAGMALLLAAAALLYEVVTKQALRRANLVWLALCLAGAGILLSGLLRFIATPLLALGMVCAALSVVATLGDNGGDNGSEPSE
ncbi:MAG: hypothetical protein V4574_17595 [Pseudomonadota bacterium]